MMNTIQYRDGGSLAKENKQMLMNQAIELKHHADELMKVLEKSNYIEPWVLSKAERATTDLSDITHYLEGNSKKMQYGGYMEEGGEVSEFNLEEFLNFIYPNVKKIMDSNNISIDKEFILSKDMQIAYVPHFMYEYEGNKVSELAIYYFDAQDKHIGHIEIDLEEKEIEVEFPSWGLDDENKYERGGYMDKDGQIEDEINKLYIKSNFINNDFNWESKLLEMLQDRSIEAYNIYQSLNESEKESVLEELFEMDNDMGSEGDGKIETSKENLDILLEDAESGKYYSYGGYMEKGGAKFSEKVKSISKRLNRTQVPSKYRSEYGETYNSKESELAASRIAGSMIKKGY